MVLLPVRDAFDERGNALQSIVAISFGIGASVWFVMLLFPKINMRGIKRLQPGLKSLAQSESFPFLREILTPSRNYPAFLIIIWVNILVFIAMVVRGRGFLTFRTRDLLAWGANHGPLVEQGEWWRLLINIFLHGGFAHIVVNMYALYFVGAVMVEPLIGRLGFAAAYMLCGIVASYASIWWNASTVSVGASGAVFGMFGVWLALLLTKNTFLHLKQSSLVSIFVIIGISLVFGFAIPGVDNAAHIGGLLAGIVTGFMFSFLMRWQRRPGKSLPDRAR